MPGNFLDSNVLLYFAAGDATKADCAEALMEAGGTISVQVLNELAAVMRGRFGYKWDEITAVLQTVRCAFQVKPLLLETHEHGLLLAERYGLSIYDSMIVASALNAECDTLWSEDMHHGLVVERQLTIRNPFR